ncbi:ATP-binding cassette domain-containing protein [Leucobacter luti]|uniref:ATP-binding cassette domain-containing protein n=1 Tax=Leucobacter luti TaxID=340320 RepID=UPI003D05C637
MNAKTEAAATREGVAAIGLSVEGPAGTIVEPLDLEVRPGRTLAIIGESGSGKSMTARALTGLLPRGTSATGEAEIDGHRYSLASRDDAMWAGIRGRRAVLLLQDPFTSLSPVIRCGDQIAATIRARVRAETGRTPSRAEVAPEVARRLEEVRLPAETARRYPSELSGGMRQRVAIAAALAAEPRLLIADEPTTALDASNQGGVLDLLRELLAKHRMSLILISHDLGVVAGRADDLLVMRTGEVVERGPAEQVLAAPQHAYTRALLEANPTIADRPEAAAREGVGAGSGVAGSGVSGSAAVLSARGISKSFGAVRALSDASVDVASGEIVAIVGESGSGKSTFARCIAGLDVPDAGTVELSGRVLSPGRPGRKPGEMQIVFQDPYSTLNPSFTIEQSLAEALRAAGRDIRSGRGSGSGPGSGSGWPDTVTDLLRLVELDPALASRRPSQLSGGQRQRVAIARALAPRPQLLICDESVSALDVSVQAQILALLARLKEELGLAMLFITHDLGVVARVASRAIVLQKGEIVEAGTTAEVLYAPQHPYTQMLVAAAEHDSIRRGGADPAPRTTASDKEQQR